LSAVSRVGKQLGSWKKNTAPPGQTGKRTEGDGYYAGGPQLRRTTPPSSQTSSIKKKISIKKNSLPEKGGEPTLKNGRFRSSMLECKRSQPPSAPVFFKNKASNRRRGSSSLGEGVSERKNGCHRVVPPYLGGKRGSDQD